VMGNLSAMANLARMAVGADQMMVAMLRGCDQHGVTRIVRPHIFAFGGVLPTAKWLRQVQGGQFEIGDNDKFDQSFRVERLHLVYSNGKTEDLQLKDQPDPQELTLQNGHNITSVEMHVMATYQSLHGTDVAISEIELFQRS